MPKLRSSPVVDMMYNLKMNKYETVNLLGRNGMSASEEVIGKAEHLRVLLLEWMNRVTGPKGYYTDKKYNLNVGLGDYDEIHKRMKWRRLDYWQVCTNNNVEICLSLRIS